MDQKDLMVILAQALEAMKAEAGDAFDIEKVNLAELGRRTGLSRSKLRTLKKNGFQPKERTTAGRRQGRRSVLMGYEEHVDAMLRQGISNSQLVLESLRKAGYAGSLSTVKRHIAAHRDLVPARPVAVAAQGDRGRRYETKPGVMYQMDWGFVRVQDGKGGEWRYACLVMVCHHCGFRYFEFFQNASQENLFIGIIHAFEVMGVPEVVLTDNMRSVVSGRDADGKPVWNRNYEEFQRLAGFETKLCKVAHPYTKGAVERCVRYIKTSFVPGRTSRNLEDLNEQALAWCQERNAIAVRGRGTVPAVCHPGEPVRPFRLSADLMPFRAPLRRISFDGYVSYEGRAYGVPAAYQRASVRVLREGHDLLILDPETFTCVERHKVDWARLSNPSPGQWSVPTLPEEFPTAPVRSVLAVAGENPEGGDRFARFNLEEGKE